VKTTFDGQVDKRGFVPYTAAAAEPTYDENATGATLFGTSTASSLFQPFRPAYPTPGSDPPMHPSVSAGVIAGAVIGGLLFLLVAGTMLLNYRKHREARDDHELANLPGSPLTISPRTSESPPSFLVPLTPVPSREYQQPMSIDGQIVTATSMTLTPIRPRLVSSNADQGIDQKDKEPPIVRTVTVPTSPSKNREPAEAAPTNIPEHETTAKEPTPPDTESKGDEGEGRVGAGITSEILPQPKNQESSALSIDEGFGNALEEIKEPLPKGRNPSFPPETPPRERSKSETSRDLTSWLSEQDDVYRETPDLSPTGGTSKPT
jgi:hypothetical protein